MVTRRLVRTKLPLPAVPGPFLGRDLSGEDAKAEGGEGLEAGRDGEVVGFLGLGGLVDEEGIVIEEFQGGAGSGAMLFEVNREPLGGLV